MDLKKEKTGIWPKIAGTPPMHAIQKPAVQSEVLTPAFRDAVKSDVKNLVELEKACFNLYGLGPANFIYLITRGHCDFIVVEIDRQLAGYAVALYKKNSLDARIYSIAVHSKFRRNNLGFRLLEEISRRAARRGCTNLRLEVDSSNFAALRFYEKQGFEKYRIVPDYYGLNKHAFQYKKPLFRPSAPP